MGRRRVEEQVREELSKRSSGDQPAPKRRWKMADEEHYQRDDGAEAYLEGSVWAWNQPADYDHVHFAQSAGQAMAAADDELEAVIGVLLLDGMAGTRESALRIIQVSGLLRARTPDEAATFLTRGISDSTPHLNRKRAREIWAAIKR